MLSYAALAEVPANIDRPATWVQAVKGPAYADDPRFVWVEDGVVRYRARSDVARGFEQLRLMGPVRFAYGEECKGVKTVKC